MNMALQKTIRCEYIHDLYNDSQQCMFVKNNEDCKSTNGILNYIELVYCTFNNGRVDAVIVYGIWITFLFVILGITTDNFFCPALDIISKTLKLSQNVAGVTLLALGNGASDIFSSLAATTQDRPELVISGLFGSGMFVSCVVTGLIMLMGPFKVKEGPFLRDIIFYLAAAFWAFAIYYARKIYLLDALGFLMLYIVYILIVLLGPYATTFIRKHFGSPNYDLLDDSVVSTDSLSNDQPIYSSINGSDDVFELLEDENDELYSTNSMQLTLNFSDAASRSLFPNRRTYLGFVKIHCTSLCLALCPVDLEEWKYGTWYYRVFNVIKAPVIIVLKITIPTISLVEPNHNWCQMLNSLHCIIVPTFITFSTGYGFLRLGALPLWSVVLIVGGAVAVLVFFTSKPHKPPVYHILFAYLGFAISIVWIYNIASEIVKVIKTIGIVFDIDDTVLGLTVLAWGNSIGDFVANYSVAKNGSQLMAISACFGGPLLNLLVGMGLPFTIEYVKRGTFIEVFYDNNVLILSSFLLCNLCSTLVAMLFLRFKPNRRYGVFLLFLYLTFTVFIILNTVNAFP